MKPLSVLHIALILVLAGCGTSEDAYESFSFTAEDAAEINTLLERIENEQAGGAEVGTGGLLEGQETPPFPLKEIVLDASQAHRYDTLRTSIGTLEENTFRVTNDFLNVRSQPSVSAEKIAELTRGNHVKLLAFENARWANVELSNGRKGYVSANYLSQLSTEEQLPNVQKLYEGQHYVNFTFVNVRSAPSTQAQKLGELVRDQFVRPLSIDGEWARIPFEGQEGFVSAKYLRPFSPSILVRQERFSIPILHYHGDEGNSDELLLKHLALLKAGGKEILTLRDFYNLIQKQEESGTRISLQSVILVLSEILPENLVGISDSLRATGVEATIFLKTSDIKPNGISASLVRTLSANGHDVQPAGHSGDDFRALTNSQVSLDIAQSRQILEELTGEEVFSIAFPDGGVNDRIAEQATQAGYLFGLTLAPGKEFSRSDFLTLPSNLITVSTSEATLKGIAGVVE